MSRYFVEHDPLIYFMLVASTAIIFSVGFWILFSQLLKLYLPFTVALGSIIYVIGFFIIDVVFDFKVVMMRGEPIYIRGKCVGFVDW